MSEPDADEGSPETDRGAELASTSDATRADLLAAIEEANDVLADSLEDAQRYMKRGEVRPSAVRGFDRIQDAHTRLVEVDPTREPPTTGDGVDGGDE